MMDTPDGTLAEREWTPGDDRRRRAERKARRDAAEAEQRG